MTLSVLGSFPNQHFCAAWVFDPVASGWATNLHLADLPPPGEAGVGNT
jgi:hypothetical protein